MEVKYPLGHHFRRHEAIPLLMDKFRANLNTRLDPKKTEELIKLFQDEDRLLNMGVDQLITSIGKG
jgi:2-methylcitrate dehydratase